MRPAPLDGPRLPPPDPARWREHPRFAEAKASYLARHLEIYSWPGPLNKLLLRGSRHLLFTFIVCAATDHREDDPRTWLTATRLKAMADMCETSSPSLVDAQVRRLVDLGHLVERPAPGYRRRRILEPTESLLAHDRLLLRVQAECCLMLHRSEGLERAAAEDPAFQGAHRKASLAVLGDAFESFDRHPEVMEILSRECGLILLYALLHEAARSPGGDRATGVDWGALGARFGVSKVHARSVLADVEARGLVSVERGRGGHDVTFGPAMLRIADAWLAEMMELFARCCDAAMDRLARPEPLALSA